MILIRSCSATQPRILKPLGVQDISNVGSHLLFKMSQDQQNLFSKGIYGLDFLNKNAEKIAAADKIDFLRNDGKYLYLDFMSVGKVLPGNEMKPDICLQQIPRACLRLELGWVWWKVIKSLFIGVIFLPLSASRIVGRLACRQAVVVALTAVTACFSFITAVGIVVVL